MDEDAGVDDAETADAVPDKLKVFDCQLPRHIRRTDARTVDAALRTGECQHEHVGFGIADDGDAGVDRWWRLLAGKFGEDCLSDVRADHQPAWFPCGENGSLDFPPSHLKDVPRCLVGTVAQLRCLKWVSRRGVKDLDVRPVGGQLGAGEFAAASRIAFIEPGHAQSSADQTQLLFVFVSVQGGWQDSSSVLQEKVKVERVDLIACDVNAGGCRANALLVVAALV